MAGLHGQTCVPHRRRRGRKGEQDGGHTSRSQCARILVAGLTRSGHVIPLVLPDAVVASVSEVSLTAMATEWLFLELSMA